MASDCNAVRHAVYKMGVHSIHCVHVARIKPMDIVIQAVLMLCLIVMVHLIVQIGIKLTKPKCKQCKAR